MNSSPISHLRCVGMRSYSRGFSLVEVVMALGIFAFAILPVIGLMGVGLNVSKESSDAATMTQICRLADVWVANTAATNSDPGPMYFSNDGEEDKTADHSNSIYQASFKIVANSDSAQGLLARKLWRMTVVRQANTNIVLSKTILQISKDPVQLKDSFWN